MSDWTVLDSIESDGMDIVTVAVKGDRTMLAFSDSGGMECQVEMGPDARDALRELLDRAAMRGQLYLRPCCDHCNNGAGDPAGHDYVPGSSAHDGPCEQCASERARREHDDGTG